MADETGDSERLVRYAVAREINERMNTRQQHEVKSDALTPTRNRTDILSALAYAAVATTMAIASYVYVGDRQHDREQLESLKAGIERNRASVTELYGELAGIRIAAAKEQQHIEEHENRSRYWIARIEAIRKEQIENTQAIHLFKANANARYDPFTGTEGAALRKRIGILENWVDKHDHQ